MSERHVTQVPAIKAKGLLPIRKAAIAALAAILTMLSRPQETASAEPEKEQGNPFFKPDPSPDPL
jgi:hypothetical protein